MNAAILSAMEKHGSIRQQVLRQFPPQTRVCEPDEELATALYFMLWSIDDLTVDGWALFRVVQESQDSLDAVGLMTLLPSGSVPIALNVTADEGGLTWSAQAALQDRTWLALSDSKRWNNVYLYATGEREVPPWTWGRQYQGRYFVLTPDMKRAAAAGLALFQDRRPVVLKPQLPEFVLSGAKTPLL